MRIVVYLKLERDYRAYAEVDPVACEACGICVEICPFHVPLIRGEGLAEISSETCRGCGACVAACKTRSIHMKYALNAGPYRMLDTESEGLTSRLDKNAVEAGLALRDRVGGRVWVVGSGPPRAKEAIRDALVMGADEGLLLCDPRFLGSDHAAAALILQRTLERMGGCDLFVAPSRSGFGEPLLCVAWLAERMGMGYVPSVRGIEPSGDGLLVRQLSGRELVESFMQLPGAVTVERDVNEPRGLSLMAAGLAVQRTIPAWEASDIGLQEDQIGESGSRVHLSQVNALPRKKGKRRKGGEILKGPPDILARDLVERLRTWHLI